jgi:hypothetical protein
MFSLKTDNLAGFEPGSSVHQADAMTTAPRQWNRNPYFYSQFMY